MMRPNKVGQRPSIPDPTARPPRFPTRLRTLGAVPRIFSLSQIVRGRLHFAPELGLTTADASSHSLLRRQMQISSLRSDSSPAVTQTHPSWPPCLLTMVHAGPTGCDVPPLTDPVPPAHCRPLPARASALLSRGASRSICMRCKKPCPGAFAGGLARRGGHLTSAPSGVPCGVGCGMLGPTGGGDTRPTCSLSKTNHTTKLSAGLPGRGSVQPLAACAHARLPGFC
ncbi:hypothetical protein CALCODRAFT_82560 [Calocera cornea HHB12733]|uniref:Uncharacterized protein n=1 Tax=Calocera cornea HHB12733 TaxID=1353952 RepID=A0A165DDB5_9BASI|nr:hypothetical protein CALCODRAFT_82560 [Calocera cornea HHB12733]